LQFEVAYRPALAVGSTVQLATAHWPNERTSDQQSAAKHPPMPQPTTLWPSSQCSLATTHCFS